MKSLLCKGSAKGHKWWWDLPSWPSLWGQVSLQGQCNDILYTCKRVFWHQDLKMIARSSIMLIILTYMFFHLPHSFERFLSLDCLACGQGNIWHFNLTPFLLLFLPLQWTVPYNFFLEKGGQFCVHLRSLTSKLGRTPSISDTSLHPSLRSDCYLKLMESFLIPETLKISWTENAGVIHIHASELQSQWTLQWMFRFADF